MKTEHLDYLLEHLVNLDYVTLKTLDAYTEKARRSDDTGVVKLLLKHSVINQHHIASATARHFQIDVANIKGLKPNVLKNISASIAHHHRVIPVRRNGKRLTIAITNPSDLNTIQRLHDLLRLDLTIQVVTEDEMKWALDTYYNSTTPRSAAA